MLLGLTGDIACGKSTVAKLVTNYGAVVLDADLLVRELYADRAFGARLAALFAVPVLQEDGTVDRAKLAPLVFEDQEALARLEALVHPAVATLRAQKIQDIEARLHPPAIVLEAVKLIESGQAQQCDVVWCVTCSTESQLQRLQQTRGLTEQQAMERLANQPAFAAKRALLGDIPFVMIENNGSLDALERQVERAWGELMAFKNGSNE